MADEDDIPDWKKKAPSTIGKAAPKATRVAAPKKVAHQPQATTAPKAAPKAPPKAPQAPQAPQKPQASQVPKALRETEAETSVSPRPWRQPSALKAADAQQTAGQVPPKPWRQPPAPEVAAPAKPVLQTPSEVSVIKSPKEALKGKSPPERSSPTTREEVPSKSMARHAQVSLRGFPVALKGKSSTLLATLAARRAALAKADARRMALAKVSGHKATAVSIAATIPTEEMKKKTELSNRALSIRQRLPFMRPSLRAPPPRASATAGSPEMAREVLPKLAGQKRSRVVLPPKLAGQKKSVGVEIVSSLGDELVVDASVPDWRKAKRAKTMKTAAMEPAPKKKSKYASSSVAGLSLPPESAVGAVRALRAKAPSAIPSKALPPADPPAKSTAAAAIAEPVAKAWPVAISAPDAIDEERRGTAEDGAHEQKSHEKADRAAAKPVRKWEWRAPAVATDAPAKLAQPVGTAPNSTDEAAPGASPAEILKAALDNIKQQRDMLASKQTGSGTEANQESLGDAKRAALERIEAAHATAPADSNATTASAVPSSPSSFTMPAASSSSPAGSQTWNPVQRVTVLAPPAAPPWKSPPARAPASPATSSTSTWGSQSWPQSTPTPTSSFGQAMSGSSGQPLWPAAQVAAQAAHSAQTAQAAHAAQAAQATRLAAQIAARTTFQAMATPGYSSVALHHAALQASHHPAYASYHYHSGAQSVGHAKDAWAWMQQQQHREQESHQQQMTTTERAVKNYRKQLLASGFPEALVDTMAASYSGAMEESTKLAP